MRLIHSAARLSHSHTRSRGAERVGTGTVLDRDGEPLRTYRALEGDPAAVETLINGYEPVLLPRLNGGSDQRLAPWNLVTGWFWVAGEPARPVSHDALRSALLTGGEHHPALLQALDRDGDGRLRCGPCVAASPPPLPQGRGGTRLRNLR